MSRNNQKSKLASENPSAQRPADAGKKLIEAFLTELDRSWQERGCEIFDRIFHEHPKLYFRALIKLAVIQSKTAPNELLNCERQRHREEVMTRLEEIA
jgi:hypothetical protein